MPGKEAALVKQLLEKTVAKAIPWEPTAQFDQFAASVGDVNFTISRYDNEYVLEMRDSQYREMRRLNSVLTSDLQPSLEQLYSSARDSALNVEDKIDSVLNELRKVS
ncbi:MAG: hypothetical protein ACYC92_06750 [Candidatus Acidiferrales bacterium]